MSHPTNTILMPHLTALFQQAKEAAKALALIPDTLRNEVLTAVAQAIADSEDELTTANHADLSRMNPTSPLYDRLRLTPQRMAGIADDMRHVATLP